MTRLRRLLQEEQGFALVIALGVTVVFSLMVVTVIESARSNSRNSTMSVGAERGLDASGARRVHGPAARVWPRSAGSSSPATRTRRDGRC